MSRHDDVLGSVLYLWDKKDFCINPSPPILMYVVVLLPQWRNDLMWDQGFEEFNWVEM